MKMKMDYQGSGNFINSVSALLMDYQNKYSINRLQVFVLGGICNSAWLIWQEN